MERHRYTARRLLGHLASLLFVIGCASAQGPVAGPPGTSSAEPVSGLLLPAPSDHHQQAYLGIGALQEFALTDIRAEVVLIEVFSMYCPHCQREAPNVNRLYRRIADDSVLAGRVKIFGIGVGNTSYEVDTFRKRFDIQFPLFPDRNRQIARQLAVRETPTFVAFAYGNDGTLHQILHAPGSLGNVEDFLTRLLERADAAKGLSQRFLSPAKGAFPAGGKRMSVRTS